MASRKKQDGRSPSEIEPRAPTGEHEMTAPPPEAVHSVPWSNLEIPINITREMNESRERGCFMFGAPFAVLFWSIVIVTLVVLFWW